ncbi:diaminopimelate decarboxylase LysA [Gottschalkia purinilytica]|uniref:Diaminopimelate decarboxylase n=1 Tax=Gottschalkia purinilytica TaxID=1503 RepID=A0A0L0WF13_GOTPU|nr:diaminopimelate decarboxylase [Gottschalkia purinilytica]KNF10016.1 diaminopimelate decarboxylase LysA [Gottschalkia purinilytica]
MKLFGTMKVDNNGILEIGGCSVLDLKREFGTPLYVIDENLVRNTCRVFKNNFSLDGLNTEVIYASKAFLNIAMCKLINEEGLSIDVVSGGELYTALKANFPPARMYMHGNNKTVQELTLAVESGVGRIIVDNNHEIDLLEDICRSLNKTMTVLLRINPGIEAHTHEYIQTTKHDSKFGESIYSDEILNIVNRLSNSNYLDFKGFHCHIGSQIFEEESFFLGASAMIEFAAKIKDECNFTVEELNLGGGFGVYYSNEDKPMNLEKFLKELAILVKSKSKDLGLESPKFMIEPGRSIISNAGTTLYEVGSTKSTYGGKNYIFIDGGMTDNPRPALYSAKYEGAIANKMNKENEVNYTIAGKCCESGDMIIKDIKLPKTESGDIVAVFSTGAYNYSMASNYNRLPKPPVLFVKDGKARIVVKRETYEDIIRNDVF